MNRDEIAQRAAMTNVHRAINVNVAADADIGGYASEGRNDGAPVDGVVGSDAGKRVLQNGR